MTDKKYPSDLTDEEWEVIKAILLKRRGSLDGQTQGSRFAASLGCHQLYSLSNYDLYMTQAKLEFVIINHKLMLKEVTECIVLN
jgi:hypothetical protein